MTRGAVRFLRFDQASHITNRWEIPFEEGVFHLSIMRQRESSELIGVRLYLYFSDPSRPSFIDKPGMVRSLSLDIRPGGQTEIREGGRGMLSTQRRLAFHEAHDEAVLSFLGQLADHIPGKELALRRPGPKARQAISMAFGMDEEKIAEHAPLAATVLSAFARRRAALRRKLDRIEQDRQTQVAAMARLKTMPAGAVLLSSREAYRLLNDDPKRKTRAALCLSSKRDTAITRGERRELRFLTPERVRDLPPGAMSGHETLRAVAFNRQIAEAFPEYL